jgi:hypothetical protein
MKKVATLFLLLAGTVSAASALCAMCRATLENSMSAGAPGIAAGINVGILYLFAAPYLAAAVLAYFWFKASRKNAVVPD